VPVPWPGWNTTAWHEDAAKPQTVGTDTYWLGSLSVGMRDASGQMYMRNRYYNPQTGQFTQPDPIGLAGGLNSYGFAGGDPVSYSDPYGLKIYCDAKTKVNNQSGCDLYEELRTRVNQGLRSDDQDVRAGARRLAGMLNAMNADEDRHYVVTAGVLPDNSGAGIEVAVPGRAGWWAAIVDPSQSPNNPRQEVSASPWILVAHELGGARSRSLGGGHAAGSIPAENGARMIAGCRKRWLHKGDTFVTHPGCYR
jgi:RHS repeat-associated protein